jgi:hypothetical protein
MRVNLGTIDVTDEDRKAFRKARGRSGLATREEIASLAQTVIRAELSDAHAAIAGSPGPLSPAPAAPRREAPEPSERPARTAGGTKCRHCSQPEGAAVHQFSLVTGAHTFNPAPWED